jgi:TatA/E family protein of Tat protein translocase
MHAARLVGLSGTELLIVLGLAVLLFGGKRILEVAKGLGEDIKNFNLAMLGSCALVALVMLIWLGLKVSGH